MRTVAELDRGDETNLATQSGLDVPTTPIRDEENKYGEVILT